MKGFSQYRWVVFAVLAAGGAARAKAQLSQSTLMTDLNDYSSLTQDYNLVALGNLTLGANGSDTQGGIAVEGTAAITGPWTIASDAPLNSDPTLFVNGQLTLSGGSSPVHLNNGYATLSTQTGWSWSSSNPKTITGADGSVDINSSATHSNTDPISNPIPPGWNWSTESSTLKSVSTSLASQTSTSSDGSLMLQGQTLEFCTTATTGTVVFDLNASDFTNENVPGLGNFTGIQVDVPTGVNYVINVTNITAGQTLFNVNFNSGSNDSNLLWNLEGPATGSENVTLSNGGNIYGSILAPTINLTENTIVNGQIVSDNFTDDNSELHDDTFTPDQLLVPESPVFGLAALGLCAVAVGLPRLRRAMRSARLQPLDAARAAAVSWSLTRRRRLALQARAALVPLASSVSK
jgi:choice-of-anchor A domain-containing protein